MSVDLRYLSDFLELARAGSFSASARNRGISQPALTRRIQQLEAWVGAALFDRSSSPPRLTSAGEDLRPVAERIVDELQALKSRNRRKAATAPKRCMALHSLGGAYLPGRPVEISFGTYDQCFGALRQSRIDVALVYHSDKVRDARFKALSRKNLGSEVFVPVVSAAYDRDLEGRRKVGAAAPAVVELTRENYLGKALSPAFDYCKRRLGYAAGPVAARFDAVRALVEAGRGIGWLPERLVRAQLDACALRAIENPSLKVKLDVVLVAVSEESLATL